MSRLFLALLFIAAFFPACSTDGEHQRASSPPGYPTAFGSTSGAGDPSQGMRDQPEPPPPEQVEEDEEEPEQDR